jgi:hypothetical protein
MKKIQSILILLIAIFILNTHTAFALKRAVFPDDKSLQPMPRNDARTNISGNTNSTVPVFIPSTEIKDGPAPSIQNETAASDDASKKGGSGFIWASLIILLLAAIIFYIYKKGRAKNSI